MLAKLRQTLSFRITNAGAGFTSKVNLVESLSLRNVMLLVGTPPDGS